jgi:hypothetical protein
MKSFLQPSVVMVSLWRDDADKQIEERIAHLLSKTYRGLRWLWVVGDSADDTEAILRGAASGDRRITVIRHDTGLLDDGPADRLVRLGATFNAAMECVTGSDDVLLVHESDLISPPDVAERMVRSGHAILGGWVTLGESGCFYDVFAYRWHGAMFTNWPPYSPAYNASEIFEVDSVGSCWIAPAHEFAGKGGIRMQGGAVLDAMRQLRERGYKVWCDPTLAIVQPRELWVSRQQAVV